MGQLPCPSWEDEENPQPMPAWASEWQVAVGDASRPEPKVALMTLKSRDSVDSEQATPSHDSDSGTLEQAAAAESGEAPPLPTEAQVEHIQRSWALLKERVGLAQAGEAFFLRLFREHPEALGLFSKFKDHKAWQHSAKFKEHALRVMTIIDTAFTMLLDVHSAAILFIVLD